MWVSYRCSGSYSSPVKFPLLQPWGHHPAREGWAQLLSHGHTYAWGSRQPALSKPRLSSPWARSLFSRLLRMSLSSFHTSFLSPSDVFCHFHSTVKFLKTKIRLRVPLEYAQNLPSSTWGREIAQLPLLDVHSLFCYRSKWTLSLSDCWDWWWQDFSLWQCKWLLARLHRHRYVGEAIREAIGVI